MLVFLSFFAFIRPLLPSDPSYPYVMGNTWQAVCDWTFNKDEPFDPKQVAKGDAVFVGFYDLRAFRKIARKIRYPFVLVTANHDNPLPGDNLKLLNIKNVAAWFVQNIDCPASDRIHPIPIGLPNLFWKDVDFKKVKEKERDILVYVNFNILSNKKVREPCWDYFQTQCWAHLVRGRTYSDYLEDLSRSVFVVSPPGNGEDCFRTWEALYLKCYPIVLSSTLNPLYENLPVVIVNSWDELTEEFLKEKKAEFDVREWDYEKIYMPYWINQVRAMQEQIKKSFLGF